MNLPFPATPSRRVLAAVFFVSAAFVVGGFLWSYFTLRGIGQPLILNFNDRLGINQIGGVPELISYGAFGLAVIIINGFIAFALEPRSQFLARILAAATGVIAILLFLAFAAIISVN
mgnify:FL=1